MPIKKLYALFAALTLLLVACGEDEDILSQQQQRIVSFLTSTHTPRLVSEAELEEDSQLPFYTQPARGVYRYISSYYNPDRAAWPEVTPTSAVSVTFRMYEFRYSAITDNTVPFFTNDPMLEARFYNQLGLTPGVWSFEPATFDLASDRILNGWRAALIGCRGGDDVEVYMSYDRAYGDDNFAVVPKNSPVAVTFTIDRVE
ncbi:MAG: FKBP-type peptidyl-prolyl cis-trans isomerase [Alistipes sp.]|nr:FKBP-type peptidyl-prolyl cis-trans isomerase [Alistipes sp.]